MDLDKARQGLRSEDSRERLRAARFFAERALPGDRPLLEAALRRESDHYVRSAIARALASFPAGEREPVVTQKMSVETNAELAELATQLIHEFASTVGVLKAYAEDEIDGFETSESARQIDRLETVIDETRSLRDASTPADVTEVSVDQLAEALARDTTVATRWDAFVFEGEPLEATGSRAHIELTVGNALKNAVEATREAGRDTAITIAWGIDDRDFWICVHDHGSGLVAPAAELFALGRSSKKNAEPRGYGLAIAERAAATLGGSIELSDRSPEGATFTLRWPRPRQARP